MIDQRIEQQGNINKTTRDGRKCPLIARPRFTEVSILFEHQSSLKPRNCNLRRFPSVPGKPLNRFLRKKSCLAEATRAEEKPMGTRLAGGDVEGPRSVGSRIPKATITRTQQDSHWKLLGTAPGHPPPFSTNTSCLWLPVAESVGKNPTGSPIAMSTMVHRVVTHIPWNVHGPGRGWDCMARRNRM